MKMKINARQLIAEVMQRQPLWDRGHELRNERSLIDALWEEVAVLLGHSQHAVKIKWKTLKDSYRKEAKKILNDPNYKPTWCYYKQLSFIHPQLKFDNTDTTITETNSSSSTNEQIETKLEFVYENDSLQHVDNGDTSSNKGKKRKFEEINIMNSDDALETSSIEFVSKPIGDSSFEDEDMCFFKSLLPHVKQLSAQKKMLIRMKIQEIIYKEVYSSDF